MEPAYPLFLFDGLDLIVVPTERQLQSDPESVDIQSGIFEAYDSEGKRVKLTATRAKTTAVVASEDAIASREFELKLRAFLKAVGNAAADDPECQLPCLMEACLREI